MTRHLYLYFVSVYLASCAGLGFCNADGSGVPEQVTHAEVASQEPSAAGACASPARQAEVQELLAREVIRLADLLRIAELINPEIQAALEDLGAAMGRTHQAGLYPNPMIGLAAEDVPTSDFSLSRSKNTIAFIQPLVVGGRLDAAVAAGSAEEESVGLVAQARLREVQGEVRLVYVELLSVKEAMALHEELLGPARRTLEIANARFEARAIPEAEVIEAHMGVRELALSRARLDAQVPALSARLRALLGGVAIPADRIGGSLPGDIPEPDLDRLRSEVRQEHPALLAASRDIEAADRRVEQAEAERTRDIDIRLAYGHVGAEDENIVELGVGIPLPIFDRNEGRILEADHLAARASRQAEARTNDLLSDLAAAHASEVAARAETATYRDQIVPGTERAFSQAQEAYRAGKVGLRDLLAAQRALAGARLSYLKAVRDLNAARARLWAVVGPAIEE